MFQKTLLIAVVILSIATICSSKTMLPSMMREDLRTPVGQRYNPTREDPPPYTFTMPPINIMTSYWDYMIGNYNCLPVGLIPQSAGGGYMLTYTGKRAATATRRVFYSHISSSGQLINNNEIVYTNNHEGYSSLAIDPVSAKPLYAWHSNMDTDVEYEVTFTSDAFLDGIGGLFNDLATCVNNPTTISAPNGYTSTDNEFLWPSNVIGPSPIPGKRRIYVATRNAVSHAYGPVESLLISYADFNGNDIEMGTPLQWSSTSIPELNNWNHDSSLYRRPFYAVTADNSGNLYAVGYHSTTQDDITIDEPDLDIFICNNYGMGTWRRVSSYSHLPSWNPNNYFTNSNGIPFTDNQLYWGILNSGHLNASVDTNGNVQISGLWALRTSEGTYYPRYQTVKNAVFNVATEEFHIRDIYPKTYNPNSCYQPWDLVPPWGVVDAVDVNGNPVINTIYPYPHYDATHHETAMQFHYNNVKINKPNDEGMMVCVWQDSERARRAVLEQNPAYAAYADTPEIYISVSPDNGFSWSDPIVLNKQDTPMLANIKPMWVYPADKVKYMGMQGDLKLGKIGLMFYNDYTWGSNSISPPVHPVNDGGSVMFMELQILFPYSDPGYYVLDPWDDPLVLPSTMIIGASVSINGNMASSGDIVAAFVDVDGIPQLRGKGNVQAGALSTCNLTVYTLADNESIYFKLWDYGMQSIFSSSQILPSQAGGWIGTLPNNPYHINFGNTSAQVNTPSFSPPSGTFYEEQIVQLLCSTPNAQIRYTMDGTIPSITSTLYSAPLILSEDITLKARAFVNGWIESEVATATYVFSELWYPPYGLNAVVDGSDVLLSWNPGEDILIQESFEPYQDFAITFPNWLLIDYDQSFTYNLNGFTYPNNNAAMAYMIFNPSATVPPFTELAAHSGDKFAACFASNSAVNNDWIISEPLSINSENAYLSFWAKSYTSQYGLERFKVGISQGGTNQGDFTIISGTNYVSAPVNWTEYSYDLSAYTGQSIRFGIQCVSNDAFIFCLDDIQLEIGGNAESISSHQRSSQRSSISEDASPSRSKITRASARDLLGYNVYRNSQLVEQTLDTEFLDASLPDGTYTYSVTALYTSGESDPVSITVTVYTSQAPVFWQDSYDEYDDFALTFGDWQLYDLDGSPTYAIAGTSFPHDYEPMAFIVFNPSATTPPMTNAATHSGSKMLGSFAATQMANNDILLSPYVDLGTESAAIFLARSHTSEYGLERLKVGVCTDFISSPPDIVYLSGNSYIEVPTTWSQYQYDLSVYDGQRIRFAIHCVSDDSFVLWLDDFAFAGNGGSIVGANDATYTPLKTELFRNYPNPFNPETSIRYSIASPSQVRMDIYNIKGQLIRTLINESKSAGEHRAIWNGKDDKGNSVSSGVYFYKLSSGRFSSTKKMILMK